MSNFSHLKALIKKNLLISKRNIISTICEIVIPILLIFILSLLRKIFKIKSHIYSEETTDSKYYISNGTSISNIIFDYGLPYRGVLFQCIFMPFIGTVGEIPEYIKNTLMTYFNFEIYIYTNITFIEFESIESLRDYVSSSKYGSQDNPELCFGIYYKYEINFHTFELLFPSAITDGYPSFIPSTNIDPLDFFQRQPDLISYEKYLNNGFLFMMKIFYDYILKFETKEENATINFGIINNKYEVIYEDQFKNFFGFMLAFFMIIAYVIPLSFYVFKIVKEKENQTKEGMKIMGMSEANYFLSYFIQYFIENLIYSICNSLILYYKIFKHVNFCFIFLLFWLFGMNIFSLIIFFQSFMNKTRLAMILSILIYFIMFFISSPISNENISHLVKIIFSFFPQTALQFGINIFTKFEVNFIDFDKKFVNRLFDNYKILDFYVMLSVDFVFYLILGLYFENVVPHEFGTKKKWNFLCTKKFWCKNNNYECNKIEDNIKIYNESSYIKNNIIINENLINTPKLELNNKNINSSRHINENIYLNNNNINNNHHQNFFQSEENYSSIGKLEIKNIEKTFDNENKVLKGISLNLYKNEIFALLGQNGAGKSTLISILTGLYNTSKGEIYYKNKNVLKNMPKFRKIIGICPQENVLFNDLTVEEHLNLFSTFKGKENNKEEIEKILQDFSLESKRSTKIEELSGGQKRKLSIAIALIGGSKIIFLDEPTSGMDILSRRNLWEILKNFCENKIIVITTHFMQEAAFLAKRIGIINNGKLICLGTPFFLAEKFGKFIALNVTIENENFSEDVNNKIINFIVDNFRFNSNLIFNENQIEYEILSNEILFKIPFDRNENNIFNLENFFENFDENLKNLNIKSYNVSMPTLEDVFINVSKNVNEKKSNEKKISFDDLIFDENNYNTNSNKFLIDLQISMKKRLKQIYRDSKTFILEIFCPILLIFLGCAVSSIEIINDSKALQLDINKITNETQKIFYSKNFILNSSKKIPSNFFADSTHENLIFAELDNFNIESEDKNEKIKQSAIDFMNKIYNLNDTNFFCGYQIIDIDETKKTFEFINIINTRSRQATIIYPYYLIQKAIQHLSNNQNLKINFINHPFPMTNSEKKDRKKRNNLTLAFFLSISFTLIPANFITIIIKERETNTKHLQIINGISLFSYWLNNFIFELIKYYFIGGIGILIIFLFNFYVKYLFILYIFYGPSMISFTYLFSFVFKKESNAQNSVILVNFIFGALGGTVVLVMRVFKETLKYAKILEKIFRIFPSFCFCYGLNLLLNFDNIVFVDYQKYKENKENYINFYYYRSYQNILSLKFIGSDLIFMSIEIFFYLFLLILCENNVKLFGIFQKKNKENSNNNSILSINKINATIDPEIKKEIIKSNSNSIFNEKKYSIIVQNLSKHYNKNFIFNCEKTIKAINNISFCLEFGECFGLLGTNGAGKTTTFKCLSFEIFPTNGKIFIENKNIHKNFNEIRNLIGYCPQTNAIFDFLTVFENLEFYAKLKRIKSDKISKILNLLMNEMNIKKYENQLSSKLSGGNKRKLSVCIAILTNPPIILLDEPSTGIDPQARRLMWNVIHKISFKNKKSSVILTTHSIEEAENLCQRIAILVDGEFKCLGSSNLIKEKFGDGFELKITIKNSNEKYFKDFHFDDDNIYFCSKSEIENFLIKINKKYFINELNENRFGQKIIKNLEIFNKIHINKIIIWLFYIENLMKLFKLLLNYFDFIYCTNFIENNFEFKIKKNKNNQNEKKIGFLFAFIEKHKNSFNIEEYNLQQTSLEQIFNNFVKEKENNKNKKLNIQINFDLINKILE